MSFLYPAFLIGAVAIAVPIVLHLLRREVAPEVPFTAVRLLQRSRIERVHRRRLRELLLLAARVIALVLLAAAFARHYLQGGAPARLRLIAIDRSYSMGGRDRFDRARSMARSAIEDASVAERVALVAFDDRAEVLAEPGGKAEARAALDGVRPGFGGTRYRAVFDKALDVAGGAVGHLVLITDLQSSGWERDVTAALPAGWQMEVMDVGPAAANLTVAAATVEANRVVASIRNAGPVPRTGRVRLELDARPVAAADFSIRPGETASVPITWRPPGTGALAVSIDDASGLEADNTRYVVLGAQSASRLLVLAGGAQSGLYLSRALETSAGESKGDASLEERSIEVEVMTGARLSSMGADEIFKYPSVALLSTRGLERRTREALASHTRGGAGLLIAASPDLDLSVLSTMADWQPSLSAVEDIDGGQPLTLAATDPRHPIFRPFGTLAANLGQVRFTRTWRVAPEGWSVIARFSNGVPALLERSLGEGRVLLFASDLDRQWNDFPLHPSFVPFAIETARYAAGDRRRSRDYSVADAPPGAGPGPGVFRTSDNRVVSVNVDTYEGRLDRNTVQEFSERVERFPEAPGRAAELQARQTEARQSYWQYGLLVMIAALVAESFVGRS
jgi:Aerotolerance regulator N-terminal/von Willebrand factor type A domain